MERRASVAGKSVPVSVIMTVRNEQGSLPGLFDSLAEQTVLPGEVVVVDGPRELSVCEARNAGARRARGDVLVFVDDDNRVVDLIRTFF